MKKAIEQLKQKTQEAFASCGYAAKYGIVSVSNRPDLCHYQCNGALAAAKEYKKPPMEIAKEIINCFEGQADFESVQAMPPGFINIKLSSAFLASYLQGMADDEDLGYEQVEHPKTIVIDYGGANIAKPLHVGHLRPAIIGESIKRILRHAGNKVIGDAHLGDWGLPMGFIITELKRRQPELPYFDETFTGTYPIEPPFTIEELEEIYPFANAYAKDHPQYREEAKEATYLLQQRKPGYYALWTHILNVSMKDLKKNYDRLNVQFDLWKKESDVDPYIPDMVASMKENGYTRMSEGALVVDVKEETDTKEMPPCMILKSDGAALYNTTDLATIVERVKLFDPNHIIYVVDKRQSLYFEQIFRCAKKTKIAEQVEFTFQGFGTVNGKDGKPYKTRDGGIMRLEQLQKEIEEAVYKKVKANRDMPEENARQISEKVGLAALKYGDLSNQASKDYIFDVDRFTSFEGDTGPYILYTIVRIKSILSKYQENHKTLPTIFYREGELCRERGEDEFQLMLVAARYQDVLTHAVTELAPNKICQYVYELSTAFNAFYHENKILAEADEKIQSEWIAFLSFILRILEQLIDLLGIEAPDKM